jgi:hypothetical protein
MEHDMHSTGAISLAQINAQLANVISGEPVQFKMTVIRDFHFSHGCVSPLRVGSPKESTPFFPLKIGSYTKEFTVPIAQSTIAGVHQRPGTEIVDS